MAKTLYEGYRPAIEDIDVLTDFEIYSNANASDRENKDLMHVRFKLVHEGANKKGDRFVGRELRASWNTPVNKPMDWEHREPILGTITSSALATESDDRLYIPCEGVVWKLKYPAFANTIKRGYETGTLKVSMECWFTDCNIVVGEFDEVIPEKEASADLVNAVGTTVDGRFISRELVNVIFGGVGFTSIPADPDAAILACASLEELEEKHDYLHRAFLGEVLTPLSPQQIIHEHALVHQRLEKNE